MTMREDPTGSEERTGSFDDDVDATIRRLDRETVDRIAAGEVITRPARVVGELLDNALDAGATSIEVGVDGDGTDRIRVADDGCGMGRADARLAVERHATSKLAPDGDPVGVETLGFRGEALAAIAEAGTLELCTADGDTIGTRVTVAADGEVSTADAGRGRGTTVTVTDLFASRPARLASLSAPRVEFAHISRLVADYALANPHVAFRLVHDGSRTLSTSGTGRTDALFGVYDRETASQSTTFDATVDIDPVTVDLSGVLVYPSISRSTRDHIRLAVNGRPVRAPDLAAAVRAGYGRLLPDGRQPIAVVSVDIPPDRIDPNVHPAKREVGLRDGDRIAEAVERAVADALTGADLRRKAETATDLDTALSPVGEADGSASSVLAEATPIGTFRDLYVLCEADDDLLVIDTHAAHERVNYERLQRAFADEPVPTVPLDPPATLSLSADEAAAVAAFESALSTLGFETEPFGGSTRRLRTVPAPFGRVADEAAFRDALDALTATETHAPRDARETLLADLACHPSLKRGDVDGLETDDLHALLDRLGECERPFACPHGRPTVLSVPESSLATGFDRRR
ncbi:DNA mismatch repair endonuclease MutL [Halorubrum vacuolatum]|uniref:DNA mismatch repair protein MutL n=1 Tax=Halorubrum vacuolatum TaxID=63740 RepID=A0A238VT08_HALVU|nr:DNA mismatch repair endonuclease MutL [Halorubrum vacuolatum]SNR37376.1 DNA mismatch repair protein MutL [Halorubrum vacuolatum]